MVPWNWSIKKDPSPSPSWSDEPLVIFVDAFTAHRIRCLGRTHPHTTVLTLDTEVLRTVLDGLQLFEVYTEVLEWMRGDARRCLRLSVELLLKFDADCPGSHAALQGRVEVTHQGRVTRDLSAKELADTLTLHTYVHDAWAQNSCLSIHTQQDARLMAEAGVPLTFIRTVALSDVTLDWCGLVFPNATKVIICAFDEHVKLTSDMLTTVFPAMHTLHLTDRNQYDLTDVVPGPRTLQMSWYGKAPSGMQTTLVGGAAVVTDVCVKRGAAEEVCHALRDGALSAECTVTVNTGSLDKADSYIATIRALCAAGFHKVVVDDSYKAGLAVLLAMTQAELDNSVFAGGELPQSMACLLHHMTGLTVRVHGHESVCTDTSANGADWRAWAGEMWGEGAPWR